MNEHECRRIEPLLHLHRGGELSPDGLRRVEEHVRTCASCASTLDRLRRIDASLREARAEVPLHPHAAAGVAAVMTKIGGRHDDMPGRAQPAGPLPALRAALGTVFAAALLFFTFQAVRDVMKVSALETRLSAGPAHNRHADPVELARRALEQSEGGGFTGGVSAALGSGVERALGPLLARVGAERDGWIAGIGERYPELATVDPQDGLDERERRILATEGRAFLDEVRQLVAQGGEQR